MGISTTTAEAAPEISVIIPHYDDPVRLRRCLSELMRNDTAGVEIVVVDNGSPDPLDALAAAFPSVRFLVETERGAGPARNRGVRESRAPVLAFIDADCVPAPDWLDQVRAVAPRADLIGGRVSVFDETPPPRSGAEAFETVFAFRVDRYVEDRGMAITANLVTHRRVFDAVGPFGTGLSEDKEWTQRAVAKGFRLIYADGLRVGHPSRADWPALRRKWHRLTRESHALARSAGQPRLRWAVRALLMPASIVAHLPRVLLHPGLNGAGERLAAAGTLARLRLLRMVWMLRQAVGLSI